MDELIHLSRLLPPLPPRLLVGLSGGADSVALLRLLLLCGKTQVQAVHVNHGLRGACSDGDEAFVQDLCTRLRVPLLLYRAQPPAHPSENWAREARYRYFHEAMLQSGCDALALAHHMDDQAETLLLHLLRGSGSAGLGGMAEDSVMDGMRIVRPLLSFTRAQLQSALREAGQSWREDESNLDPRYLRNAVRLFFLPMMEQLAPGAASRLAAAAAIVRDESQLLNQQAEAWLLSNSDRKCLDRAALLAQHPAMQKRIVRMWWQREGFAGSREHTLSKAQTDSLVQTALSGPGSRCNLPGGWHGQCGFSCLHLLPPTPPSPPPTPVPFLAPATALGGMTLLTVPSQGNPGDGLSAQELTPDELHGCVLRFRQAGDWIRPFGSQGKQLLQDFMTARRVDAPFRDTIPLLCRGSEVLLVAGVGAGSIAPFEQGHSHVRLIWQGDMPWLRFSPTKYQTPQRLTEGKGVSS